MLENVEAQDSWMGQKESINSTNLQVLVTKTLISLMKGLSPTGDLYVLDSGNGFIRKVTTEGKKCKQQYNFEGFVSTMLHGTCKDSVFSGPKTVLGSMKINSVTCYDNWIKTSGLPDSHIWKELTPLESCFKQTLLCDEGKSTHPIIAKNSTF